MKELLSPPEAARLIGTHVEQVKKWMRRGDDPLPSVPVGDSGRRKVLLAKSTFGSPVKPSGLCRRRPVFATSTLTTLP